MENNITITLTQEDFKKHLKECVKDIGFVELEKRSGNILEVISKEAVKQKIIKDITKDYLMLATFNEKSK